MNQSVVRLAEVVDAVAAIDLVSRLLVELDDRELDFETSRPLFEQLAAGDGGFVVLGEIARTAVAVCTVSMQAALRTGGRYAIVQEMYVEPGRRSTGIGADVMRFVLERASEAGCDVVELGTPLGGERQVAFYEGLGFRSVGERLRWTADR